jgi:hypothetical protein
MRSAVDEATILLRRLEREKEKRKLQPARDLNEAWRTTGKSFLSDDQVIEIVKVALSGDQRSRARVGTDLEDAVDQFVEKTLIPMIPGAKYERQWLPLGARRTGGTNPIDGVLMSPRLVIGFSPKNSGQAGGARQIWLEERRMLEANFPGRKIMMVPVKGKGKTFSKELHENELLVCLLFGDPSSTKYLLQEIEKRLR